jgi:hypothetical protein
MSPRLTIAYRSKTLRVRTYRGGGQQKVTVEHVTVQAIVGTVNRGAGGMLNKTANEPHAKRRGWLKNANPQGNPASAPRCGARTRRGSPCGCPAIRGKKRCRMHGGLSTGPRTPAGLARSKQARWKHGAFSAEARQEMAHCRQLLRELQGTGRADESLASETQLSEPRSNHEASAKSPLQAYSQRSESPRFREESLHLGMRAAVDQVL